jgi:hypothetical protein
MLSVSYAECQLCSVSNFLSVVYAECQIQATFMPSVTMLNVVMLSVVEPKQQLSGQVNFTRFTFVKCCTSLFPEYNEKKLFQFMFFYIFLSYVVPARGQCYKDTAVIYRSTYMSTVLRDEGM